MRVILGIPVFLLFSGISSSWAMAPALAPTQAPCSAAQLAEILAPATEDAKVVRVKCSVQLDRSDYTITKNLLFEGAKASGIVFDCRGSTIAPTFDAGGVQVISVPNPDGTWSRPTDITIRNCTIRNTRVLIAGTGRTTYLPRYRESSRLDTNHTIRTEATAPTRILLLRNHLIGDWQIPLYIAPGVTQFTFQDSTITGTSDDVCVYLDSESGRNVFKNNRIECATGANRELIAVDGSAYNLFVGNRFASLNHGGIYLYRNCGEAGIVRHQTPSYNQIINNTFYYDKYDGENPAISVSSRNGNRNYCGADQGYPFGSSVSDLDLAQYNVIAENQIYKFSPSEMIHIHSSPNSVLLNENVKDRIVREPGCYFNNGQVDGFVHHGDYVGRRTSLSEGTRRYCDRGVLLPELPGPTVQRISFTCDASNSNAGCQRTTSCPDGRKLVGIHTACHLELAGTLSSSSVTSMEWDRIKVAVPSDHVSEGQCGIFYSDGAGYAISAGESKIPTPTGTNSSFHVSCREHDKNGGDCTMWVEALCI